MFIAAFVSLAFVFVPIWCVLYGCAMRLCWFCTEALFETSILYNTKSLIRNRQFSLQCLVINVLRYGP